MCIRFKSQSLSLERDCSAAGKRIEEFDRFISAAFADLCLCRIQYTFIVRVFPNNHLLQNAKETFTLLGLIFFGGKFLRMRGRVIHKRSPNDSTSRCQRSSRPPQMQSRRMTVTNRLLSRRRLIYCLEGQRHFDEFLYCHVSSFSRRSVPTCISFEMLKLLLASANPSVLSNGSFK